MANEQKKISLDKIVSTAIQIKGVKVERNDFLSQQFKDESPKMLEQILEAGPVESGISQKQLSSIAHRLVRARVALSTSASILAGLPGGLAMAATIPADLLQFYGITLRLAQELMYLYGESDLWEGEQPDSEKVQTQLILYCGVMLGITGAAQAVRLASAKLAKQALAQLPKQALTKKVLYQVARSIVKVFGVKMTKAAFSKAVAKALPIVGGVVSGGLTLASMAPMGMRLANALDKAHFSYTAADLNEDLNIVTEIYQSEEEEIESKSADTNENVQKPSVSRAAILEEISCAKQMFDSGVLTEAEFTEIKEKLIVEL